MNTTYICDCPYTQIYTYTYVYMLSMSMYICIHIIIEPERERGAEREALSWGRCLVFSGTESKVVHSVGQLSGSNILASTAWSPVQHRLVACHSVFGQEAPASIVFLNCNVQTRINSLNSRAVLISTWSHAEPDSLHRHPARPPAASRVQCMG